MDDVKAILIGVLAALIAIVTVIALAIAANQHSWEEKHRHRETQLVACVDLDREAQFHCVAEIVG